LTERGDVLKRGISITHPQMLQDLFLPYSPIQIALQLAALYLTFGSVIPLLIGAELVAHGATASNIGRWRYGSTAWAIASALMPFVAAFVYLRHRTDILESYPTATFAYHPQIRPVLVAAMLPLAVAGILLTLIPEDRCNSPERLRGLERALSSSAEFPLESVAAKSAQLDVMNLFTGEAYCRAVVDIQWRNDKMNPNSAIWFRVVRFGKGWGSQVSPELQKREFQYQYDLLKKG
jgi:hypothetical protein